MASFILVIIKISMENDYKPNYLVCISSYNPNTQRKTHRLGFAFLYSDIWGFAQCLHTLSLSHKATTRQVETMYSL